MFFYLSNLKKTLTISLWTLELPVSFSQITSLLFQKSSLTLILHPSLVSKNSKLWVEAMRLSLQTFDLFLSLLIKALRLLIQKTSLIYYFHLLLLLGHHPYNHGTLLTYLYSLLHQKSLKYWFACLNRLLSTLKESDSKVTKLLK